MTKYTVEFHLCATFEPEKSERFGQNGCLYATLGTTDRDDSGT